MEKDFVCMYILLWMFLIKGEGVYAYAFFILIGCGIMKIKVSKL